MSRRPSRARMCSWLESALRNIRTRPFNPADTKRLVELSHEAEQKISDLSWIAGELGFHHTASLDEAWVLIQEYEAKWDRPPDAAEVPR